jgi:hypothetical protein
MNQNTVSNRGDLKALDAFIAAQNYKIKAEKTWFVPKIQTAASLKYMDIFWAICKAATQSLTAIRSRHSGLRQLLFDP